MSSIENVGPGWQPIVKEAVAKIEQLGGRILQIKEKFGGLRIYYVPASHYPDTWPQITRIVEDAEKECWGKCEECGQPGETVEINGWLKTRCKGCCE